ncbi:MAG TPA: HAD-IA family hydrolase, partial [Verrucomicrobiae bacterium]|nr:HAD-IA family hydrolase [Verrucomicrobiae bacterium]
SLNDFNAKFAERLGVPSVNWQEYYLGTIEPIIPMQELLEWTIQHYKAGLMTNTMPGFVSQMRRNKHLPDVQFDAIIDSSAVGAIKPEPEVYKIAQEHAGCQPEEILLIDDSRANLMAAERAGWKVLWFDDSRPEESAKRAREVLEPADGPEVMSEAQPAAEVVQNPSQAPSAQAQPVSPAPLPPAA